MDDRTLVDTGMGYAQETMEVADDVVQALLAALAGRSTPDQAHVLRSFARHVERGGRLYTIQSGQGHLEGFDGAARELGLAYQAAVDQRTGQATIIVRDQDLPLLEQVVKSLAAGGSPSMMIRSWMYPGSWRSMTGKRSCSAVPGPWSRWRMARWRP